MPVIANYVDLAPEQSRRGMGVLQRCLRDVPLVLGVVVSTGVHGLIEQGISIFTPELYPVVFISIGTTAAISGAVCETIETA